eukprot:g23325.t1
MSDGLQQQYSQGLDAFALGICTLEVLSKLHGSFSLPKEAGEDPQIELMESINQFQKAWSRYWSFAILCFEKLAEYSQMVCFNEQQRATQLWEDTLWPPKRPAVVMVRRRFPAVGLCFGLVTLGFLQELAFSSCRSVRSLGQAVSGTRLSLTARHAEAFDPFGWKGAFKDTVEGLMDRCLPRSPR